MRKNQLSLFLFFCSLFVGFVSVFFLIKQTNAITGRIQINQFGDITKHRLVTLFFNAPTGFDFQMIVSNDIHFNGAHWEKYQPNKQWELPFGNGTYTVYAKFKAQNGTISNLYSDNIILAVPTYRNVDFKINDDATKTNSRIVHLSFEYSEGVELMAISNSPDLSGIEYRSVTKALDWTLSESAGTKTLYVEFKDGNGQTEIVKKSIEYTELDPELKVGSLVKSKGSLVYYAGVDGKLHPFLDMATYYSWYTNLVDIQTISPTLIRQYQIGSPVCVRPGTFLIQFKGISRIYAPEPGCHLRPMHSAAEAFILYGHNWNSRVITLDFFESNFYSVRGFSAARASENMFDGDHDGVETKTEALYGSSDAKEDTDGDGLTDYEEIYYWKSNPIQKDTDGDTYVDGQEIEKGFSPIGSGLIRTVPKFTYKYPHGAFDTEDSSLFSFRNQYDLPIDDSFGPHNSSYPNIYINNTFSQL